MEYELLNAHAQPLNKNPSCHVLFLVLFALGIPDNNSLRSLFFLLVVMAAYPGLQSTLRLGRG